MKKTKVPVHLLQKGDRFVHSDGRIWIVDGIIRPPSHNMEIGQKPPNVEVFAHVGTMERCIYLPSCKLVERVL